MFRASMAALTLSALSSPSMSALGDIEPKCPQHYRRRDWIDPALRKKIATESSWPFFRSSRIEWLSHVAFE